MIPELLRPKRRRWFRASLAIAAGSVAIAAGRMWWAGWSPGDLWGLTFGTLASAIMVAAALYPLRRRLARWPLRTAQDWLQFHVYGSTLAALFVLIHIGFRWPGGQFAWWLLGLTLWTTVSGLAGVALQKRAALMLARQLSVEAVFERIPEMVDALQTEAARIMNGAPAVLARFYENDVRPALALSPSWSQAFAIGAGRERALGRFQHIHGFVEDADRPRLAELQTVMLEKIELEIHYSVQRLLRAWPLLHVPPAMLLLAILAGHVAAVWYD